MVDLKNVKVDFPPDSAYAILHEIVLQCGIDSVSSALDEIAAQHIKDRTETCACPTVDGKTYHVVGCSVGFFASLLPPNR